MAKETTIQLTPEQREQIRKLTGQEHDAVKIEAVPDKTGSHLAVRSALSRKKMLSRKHLSTKR